MRVDPRPVRTLPELLQPRLGRDENDNTVYRYNALCPDCEGDGRVEVLDTKRITPVSIEQPTRMERCGRCGGTGCVAVQVAPGAVEGCDELYQAVVVAVEKERGYGEGASADEMQAVVDEATERAENATLQCVRAGGALNRVVETWRDGSELVEVERLLPAEYVEQYNWRRG